MNTVLEAPTKAEQKMAKDTISKIVSFSGKRRSPSRVSISLQLGDKKETLQLSAKIFTCLKFILSNMAEGKALQFVPVVAELTTQQAADILKVSRPFLIKLLEQGKIPYKKVGAHRRVAQEDLQVYQRQQQAERDKNLDFITRQAQELNLGYE